MLQPWEIVSAVIVGEIVLFSGAFGIWYYIRIKRSPTKIIRALFVLLWELFVAILDGKIDLEEGKKLMEKYWDYLETIRIPYNGHIPPEEPPEEPVEEPNEELGGTPPTPE